MRVKLISGTQVPINVMYIAARTCYSSKSPIELWIECENKTTEEKWKLIKQVLDSGHQSIAEHVYLSFAIGGISRACSHQLVRHRAGIVFSQQSQRYVKIKEDLSQLDFLYKYEEVVPILDKYFVDVDVNNWQFYKEVLMQYLHKLQMGIAPEDARVLLPNATKTNITMSLNLRELIHISNLRLCTRAQKEIRQLFTLIKEEVAEKYNARIADYLVPQCEVHGFCKESKCCGRKPKLKDFKNGCLR